MTVFKFRTFTSHREVGHSNSTPAYEIANKWIAEHPECTIVNWQAHSTGTDNTAAITIQYYEYVEDEVDE